MTIRFPNAVVIVSDRPLFAEGLRLALGRAGIARCVASDMVAAVHWLFDAPGAIVLDFESTGVDPHQFLRRAGACPESHRAPIVAVGAPPEEEASLLDSGCSATLPRGSGPWEVVETIVQLMRQQAGAALV